MRWRLSSPPGPTNFRSWPGFTSVNLTLNCLIQYHCCWMGMKVQLPVGTGKNRGEENLEYWLVPTHAAYTVCWRGGVSACGWTSLTLPWWNYFSATCFRVGDQGIGASFIPRGNTEHRRWAPDSEQWYHFIRVLRVLPALASLRMKVSLPAWPHAYHWGENWKAAAWFLLSWDRVGRWLASCSASEILQWVVHFFSVGVWPE